MGFLPESFLNRMKDMLGDEFEEFLEAFERPRTYGLRVNTAKLTPQELLDMNLFPLRQIPWVPNGFFYEGNVRPAQHPLYAAGAYYLQEPSAMTPAACLPVTPGEKVLDLCAAPGGKATELGAKLQGKGLLVANDISASRARALLYNLEVFGVPNAFVTNETPARLAEAFEGFFDKILVDAPCSGEGMFRKEEAMARDWTPEKSEGLAQQQREILGQAARMLRPGGKLLYSTCTFAPCEDEQTISWLLETCPEMHLIPLPEAEGFSKGNPAWGKGEKELALCVRLWPHKMEGEGHFLALLEKDGEKIEKTDSTGQEAKRQADEADTESRQQGKERQTKGNRREGAKRDANRRGRGNAAQKSERELLEEFLVPCSRVFPEEQIEVRAQKVYLVPQLPVGVQGMKFLRNGLLMGEIKKDRFEPSQQLAMALRAEEFSERIDLPLGDERANRYLRGETLTIAPEETNSPAGWKLVCVGGYPLGWGKLVNGVLKNKYQNSWRKN